MQDQPQTTASTPVRAAALAALLAGLAAASRELAGLIGPRDTGVAFLAAACLLAPLALARASSPAGRP